jgi:acetyltransferase-like isoleucine patch superfamily enzyme
MKRLFKILYLRLKWRDAFISLSSNVSLDSRLSRGVKILSGARIGSVNVGSYTYIGERSSIERTQIGRFCSIAPEVIIGLASHPTDHISTYPGFYSYSATGAHFFGNQVHLLDKKNTEIGHDVWIGARAVIVGGVKIGTGAIVATGAVVTKNVPSYAVVGGVPAKVLRYRFESQLCEAILATKWWELSEDKLSFFSPLFPFPYKFIEKLNAVSLKPSVFFL